VSMRTAYTPEAPAVERLDESLRDKGVLKAIFVVGSGGAGKTRIAKDMFPGAPLKEINADVHLEAMLKWAKISPKEVGAQPQMFTKARDIRNNELRYYAVRRRGLVIDCTGWAYDRVAGPYHKLRKLGYDCTMVCITVSNPTAHRRNVARAKVGGRNVPSSFIDDAWYGLEKNKARYKKLFGKKRFYEIKNDVDLTPAFWQKNVVPQLRTLGRKVLSLSVANTVGQEWLKKDEKLVRQAQSFKASDWPEEQRPTFARVRDGKTRGALGLGKQIAGTGKTALGMFKPKGAKGFTTVK